MAGPGQGRFRRLSKEGCYLLKEEFLGDAPAPLQTPRFCYQGPGTLTLDQTDGQFSIVGNEFVFPAQGTPVWGDQDWYALNQNGDPFARELGQVLKWRWAFTLDAEAWAGWNDDITPSTRALAEHPVYQNVGGAGIRCLSGGSDDQALYDLAPAAGWWQAAVALSPYDNAGLHWYPGKAVALTHGAHFFFRDEAGDDSWRLAWYRQLANNDPLYPAFSNLDSSGMMDFVYDPCATFEDDLLTPTAWDEFTDNNGVLLPNHTMTYGGLTWVNAVGVWQITGNEADPDATAHAVAVTPTTKPDVWIETDVLLITSAREGMIARKSADTAGGFNDWAFRMQCDNAGNDTDVYERNNGVWTARATMDLDPVCGWHNMRVRCNDEELTLYTDYVERLHFAAAWFNKHATWHGLYSAGVDAARFDNFIILPRGTGLTRIAYDAFTDANGTLLPAHTMDEGGLAWVNDVGVWAIQVNEADPDATADAHAYTESLVSNAWVTARCLVPNAVDEWVGLALRKSADTGANKNYWYFRICNTAGNDVQITEVDNGVATIRNQADTDAFAVNTRYYLQAYMEGQIITGYVDGTQRATYASASFNEMATRHGVYNHDDTTARFDQFRVTEIPALGEYDAALDSF